MTSSIFDLGTISAETGSAVVTGDGTAWVINGVSGGMFSCAGMSIPIASVESDTSLTLAYPWPGDEVTGGAYAISLLGAQAAETIWASRHWARVVGGALLSAIPFKASGTAAERDALNPPLANGEWFGLAEPDAGEIVAQLKVPDGWLSFTTRGIAGVGEGGLGLPSPGAADKLPYYSAPDTVSLADLTAFARSILAGADAEAVRGILDAIQGPVTSTDGAVPLWDGAGGDKLKDGPPLSDLGAVLLGLTGAAGSFIRATGADTAVMQSIVGTVSQVSGVPTGAIVETGTNANGSYVRFADGTQICMRVGTMSATIFVWTYPAAFEAGGASMFAGTGFGTGTGTAVVMKPYGLSNPTSANLLCIVATDGGSVAANTSASFGVMTIGRWY